MITRNQLISIGHYNKPHGVYGEISATLDIDISFLNEFKCLVSDIDGIFVPFFITELRTKNVSTALLKIDGIKNEDEAGLLVNKEIFVLKNEYEQLSFEENVDEYPLDYFIGYELYNNDDAVGRIIDIDDSTENVLFIVELPDKSHVQIPAVDDLVEELQENEQKIVMNLPEGLLNI